MVERDTMPSVLLRIKHYLNFYRAHKRYRLYDGQSVSSAELSARLSLEWLCKAQDVTGTGGFAASYSLISGWGLPYPETTGYILPTLIAYNHHFSDLQLKERARQAGTWLSEVQFDSGALCAKQYRPDNKIPSVFNTGMGIHGWVSLAQFLGGERFLSSAIKAGDWIVSQQEPDGSWIRSAFKRIPHTYYTMVDWALLRLYSITRETRFKNSAIRNLDWALSHQQ